MTILVQVRKETTLIYASRLPLRNVCEQLKKWTFKQITFLDIANGAIQNQGVVNSSLSACRAVIKGEHVTVHAAIQSYFFMCQICSRHRRPWPSIPLCCQLS